MQARDAICKCSEQRQRSTPKQREGESTPPALAEGKRPQRQEQTAYGGASFDPIAHPATILQAAPDPTEPIPITS
jgi:hypothetical protein